MSKCGQWPGQWGMEVKDFTGEKEYSETQRCGAA